MDSKTPTNNVWKNALDEYPEYKKDKYIWNKDIDKYTKKEMEEIAKNVDKIDMIYNSGIAFLEQINATIKTHQNRIAVLLGYLLLVATSLIAYLFKDGAWDSSNHFQWFVLAIAFGCFALTIRLYYLLIGQRAAVIHFPPKSYMTKENFKQDTNIMKIDICLTLQLITEKNLSVLEKIASKFKFYVKLALWVSAVSIVMALVYFAK